MAEQRPNNLPCDLCQPVYCDRSDRSTDAESDVFLDPECNDHCCSQDSCRGLTRHDTIDEESHLDTVQLTADSSFHEHMKDIGEMSNDDPDKFRVPNVIKKYFSCAGKDKSYLYDDDNEQYGFSDLSSMKYKNEIPKALQGEEKTENESLIVSNASCCEQDTNPPRSEGEKRMLYKKNSHKRQKDAGKRPSPYEYDFTNEQRGYMVIIINEKFERQQFRDGAFRDLVHMRNIARKFGFIIFNSGQERNLTKPQTISLLRQAQRANHSKCDCFAFVVSTHGLEQRNPRANGKKDHSLVCSDDQLIFTSSILEMFDDEHCPSLKGKPKLFFIQACRGEELDHGTDVLVAYPRRPLPRNLTGPNGIQTFQNLRPHKDAIEETDTLAGPDSWAVFPSTSTNPDPVAPSPARSPLEAATLSPRQPTKFIDTAVAQINTNMNLKVAEAANSSLYNPGMNDPIPANDEALISSVPPVNRLPPYPHFFLRKFPPKTQIMSSPSPNRALNSDRPLSKNLFENGSLRTNFIDLNLHVSQPIRQSPRSPRELMPGYNVPDAPALICRNDMLLLYAVPQGKFAWRNQDEGSWMILYLHEVLMGYNMQRPKNLLNLLTKVNALMARRLTQTPGNPKSHRTTAVAMIEHNLIKDIIFQEKVPITDWVPQSIALAV